MMRWLLGLLVVGNVVIFLWGQSIIRPREPAVATVLPEFGDIRLVGEPAAVEAPVSPVNDPTEDVMATEPAETPAEVPLQTREAVAAAEQPPQPTEAVAATEAAASGSDAGAASTGVLPEQQAAAAEPTAAIIPPPAQPPTPLCGRAGPFDSEQAASDGRKQLENAGYSVAISPATDQVAKGYWVLIPELPSREEGKEMVARLKAAGVTDIWLFNKGPRKNAISLGLYAGKNNAGRRSEQINGLGFNSVVQPKVEERTVFWLEYRGEVTASETTRPQALFPGVGIEKKSCE